MNVTFELSVLAEERLKLQNLLDLNEIRLFIKNDKLLYGLLKQELELLDLDVYKEFTTEAVKCLTFENFKNHEYPFSDVKWYVVQRGQNNITHLGCDINAMHNSTINETISISFPVNETKFTAHIKSLRQAKCERDAVKAQLKEQLEYERAQKQQEIDELKEYTRLKTKFEPALLVENKLIIPYKFKPHDTVWCNLKTNKCSLNIDSILNSETIEPVKCTIYNVKTTVVYRYISNMSIEYEVILNDVVTPPLKITIEEKSIFKTKEEAEEALQTQMVKQLRS